MKQAIARFSILGLLVFGVVGNSAHAQVPTSGSIQVFGGVTGDRVYLSTNDDGTVVDLWGAVGERQTWQFKKAAEDSYYIIVSGGVTGDRKYLDCSPNGTEVYLSTEEEKSPRKMWEIVDRGDWGYAIFNKARDVCLSSNEDGTVVELAGLPDESERQRWKIK